MNRRIFSAKLALGMFIAVSAAGSALAQAPGKPAGAAKPSPAKPAPPAPPAKPSAEPTTKPAIKPLQDPSEIADELHVQAEQAAAKGDWPTARELLRRAWNLKQSYDIAANRGLAAFELKDFAESAEFLDYALAHIPTDHDDAQVAQIQKKFDLARAEIATVRVNVNVEGCDVAVDGTSRGKAPLAVSIYLAPGRHGFEGTAAGYEPAREERAVDKGTQVVVTLTLRKVGDHSEPVPDARLPLWPAFLIGGLGVAGLAAGGGLFAVAGSKGSQATDAIASVPAGGCASDAASCQQIDDLRHQQHTMKSAGVWSLAGGGALLVGGVAYGIAAKVKNDAASVRVSPTAGGLIVEGVF